MLSEERTMPIRQSGMILIEALIGVLIFSMGILALVAMQTAAVSAQSDAQYRIEAANFANRMLGEIWLNTDRTSSGTFATTFATFAHQTTGAACNFSGAASTNPVVTSWVNDVTAAGTGLPGATAAMQQILVDSTAGNFNRVTITVCWKAPNDAVVRKHVVISNVN
jgi:type IV pilus assembly protein PilV